MYVWSKDRLTRLTGCSHRNTSIDSRSWISLKAPKSIAPIGWKRKLERKEGREPPLLFYLTFHIEWEIGHAMQCNAWSGPMDPPWDSIPYSFDFGDGPIFSAVERYSCQEICQADARNKRWWAGEKFTIELFNWRSRACDRAQLGRQSPHLVSATDARSVKVLDFCENGDVVAVLWIHHTPASTPKRKLE